MATLLPSWTRGNQARLEVEPEPEAKLADNDGIDHFTTANWTLDGRRTWRSAAAIAMCEQEHAGFWGRLTGRFRH